MALEEKESDNKLYKVYYKKGNHPNKKTNLDGTKAAIQFTNDENNLDGPLEIVEVDDNELMRTEYVEIDPRPRTWKEMIVEEIIVPVAKEAIDQVLEIGYQHIEVWLEKKAVPATKKKAKEVGHNVKIFLSGVNATLKGEEPKAIKILREKEESEKSVEILQNVESVIDDTTDKERIQISQEEFEHIISLTRKSAGILIGCITLLRNTAVSNKNIDPQQQLALQKQLDELTTSDILGEIDLLLEEKNRDILDAAALKILAAFREGNFIIDDEFVPISQYIENRQ
jgi:hypothetical protein